MTQFAYLRLFSILTAFDDDNLNIERNDTGRSDHPFNSRRGGVCIYYNQLLVLEILDIIHLEECFFSQVLIANELCNFIFLYQSPSQPTDIFDPFADNLELNLD